MFVGEENRSSRSKTYEIADEIDPLKHGFEKNTSLGNWPAVRTSPIHWYEAREESPGANLGSSWRRNKTLDATSVLRPRDQ